MWWQQRILEHVCDQPMRLRQQRLVQAGPETLEKDFLELNFAGWVDSGSFNHVATTRLFEYLSLMCCVFMCLYARGHAYIHMKHVSIVCAQYNGKTTTRSSRYVLCQLTN